VHVPRTSDRSGAGIFAVSDDALASEVVGEESERASVWSGQMALPILKVSARAQLSVRSASKIRRLKDK
jgi:hypothetical protein